MALAWHLTDPVFRLARAQAWLYNNKDHPELATFDLDELAAAFSEPTCDLPLWAMFAAMEVVKFRDYWRDWDPGEVGYLSGVARPTELDHELMLLVQERDVPGGIIATPTAVTASPLLMHLIDGD